MTRLHCAECHRADRRILLQAGIGNEDINGSKFADAVLEHILNRSFVAHVSPMRERLGHPLHEWCGQRRRLRPPNSCS